MTASVVALGGPGYADSAHEDEEDIVELTTVAGQSLASIGAFSAGLFGRMHREGEGEGTFSTCFSKSGDLDDDDEDGIPEEMTLEFDKCPSNSGFGIGTVSGSIEVRDADDDESDGAFEADLDLKFEATEEQPFDWTSATTWLEGTMSGEGRREGTATRVISQDLEIRTDLVRNGESHTVESDTSWDVAFIPDEGFGADERGAPGEVWINGDWSFDIDGVDADDAEVKTIKPLRLMNTECAFGADYGELLAEFDPDDVPHTLRVMWTGCNQASVSVTVEEEEDEDDGEEEDD